ncbi:MAG: TIM barrel protein, partial [Firmicutes bacterium]|nr:TIM barrel protein [Bacillota bacterium]
DYLINAINILCAYDPNINIYLETHGDFNNHKTLLPIVNNIKYENFGLIWDIYHTYRYYHNDFEPFYNCFKPYIKHIHIKDSLNDHPVLFGKGEIDVQKVINKLTDDQYQGYLSIEWEKKWYDDLEDLEDVLKSFNDYIKKSY